MLAKIKKIPFSDYIKSLSDIRTVGLVIFCIIVLLVTWSGIKVVQTNYDLQKQISVMKQQNDVKKIENSNLALRNKYFETDDSLELVARKQFNKALPGETMVIVPKSVALAHSVEPTKGVSEKQPKLEDNGPTYERNFNAWIDFLFKKKDQ